MTVINKTDFDFANWLVETGKGSSVAQNIAAFLVERQGASGLHAVVSCMNGCDLTDRDLYAILKQAEPLELGKFYESQEVLEEAQARLDNARGKRY